MLGGSRDERAVLIGATVLLLGIVLACAYVFIDC